MARPAGKVPSYRRHKASGQAIVTFDRDYYLGAYGTPLSHKRYARLVRQWLTHGEIADWPKACLTIDDLMAKYWLHAEAYYQRAGEPTGELANIRYALRPLHELYGDTPATKFGPKALKAVRHAMLDQGLCRNVINRRICKIKRLFKWAVSEELLPARVYEALATVEGLKKHRSKARETDPVEAVDPVTVEKTLPLLPRVIQDMVRIQMLTGCRPGELCAMRSQDIDRSRMPWVYRPRQHKTEHLNEVRTVLIGPRAAAILEKYLDRPPDTWCFSPRESEAQRKAAMRACRKTPVQPSQRDRSRPDPSRIPASRYTRTAYHRAIRRACQRAGIPLWSPNQLRHAAASELFRRFGLEITQTVLGHKKPDTTRIYIERQHEQASAAILAVG